MIGSSVLQPQHPRHWEILRRIYTSISIWKTTSCFPARLRWNGRTERSEQVVRIGNAHREPVRAVAYGRGDFRDFAGAREESLAPADSLHHDRPCFHAAAGDLPRRLESARDQQPSYRQLGFRRLGASARARADLRLDRHVYPGDRLLLDPEVAAYESVRTVGGEDVLDALDRGCHLALADRNLPLAVARVAPGFGGARTRCLP